MKKYLHSLFLILTSMWLGWTVLVDFFVVRTVFSVVSNFFEAGDLGIAVFSRLNHLEVVVSTTMLAILSIVVKRKKSLLPTLALSLLAWSLSMFYFSFLTPKLVMLTALWKKADTIGSLAIAGYPDIQQTHQFWHNLYIGLDSVKLLTLITLVVLCAWKREHWT